MPGCLVLDVGLPDLNGLELQDRIVKDRVAMPIIVVTGDGDIPTTVRAMKAGAIEFLVKPLSQDLLLPAINKALLRSSELISEAASLAALRARFASLTAREKEVMALVTAGKLNKQIAGELGISEITVKAHRGRVMQKMRVRSLAELVKIAASLRLNLKECRI